MRTAIVQDFIKAGFCVSSPVDERVVDPIVPGEIAIPVGHNLETTLQQAVADTDFVVVIAPECDGILLRCSEWFADHDAKRLFPSHEFIELCSDKKKTLQIVAENGVATPSAVATHSGRFVIKPNFGCGSEGIRVVEDGSDLSQFRESAEWVVEPFIDGVPILSLIHI